jgi:hypothetical protein
MPIAVSAWPTLYVLSGSFIDNDPNKMAIGMSAVAKI